MAGAATASYSTDALTSSSLVDGSHQQQQQWDFAVPVLRDSANTYSKSQSSYESTPYTSKSKDRSSNLSQSSSRSRQQINHNHTNNINSSSNNNSNSNNNTIGAFTSQEEALSRTAISMKGSGEKVSEMNGLYGRHDTDPDAMEMRADEDPERANWIHRDKLARIESEELQQAAIMYQRRVRTGSKSSASKGRAHHHESHPSGVNNGSFVAAAATAASDGTEPWPNLRDEEPRGRSAGASAIPPADKYGSGGDGGGDEDDENDENYYDGALLPEAEERMNWDLRLPEEIAAEAQGHRGAEDGAASGFYRNPGLKKSSSRIPIATTSPVPISLEQLGREFPANRTRTLTNGDEDSGTSEAPRRASEPISMAEAAAADAADAAPDPFPPNAVGGSSSSRPNSRGVSSARKTASKTTTTTAGSTNRKTSAPPTTRRPAPKSRTTSSQSTSTTSPPNQQRGAPRSRANRPINRPEGDPPWLATMYNPDPRLPPEQQIIPTHARKLQQEQWAKDGKAATTYDREFAPLVIPSNPAGPATTLRPENNNGEKDDADDGAAASAEDSGLSPKPLAPSKSPDPGSRPATSSGYSPIPKLQNTPPIGLTQSINWTANAPVVTVEGPPPKEKGCACCIVM